MKESDETADIHATMATQHGAATTKQVRADLAWRKQRALVDERVWQQDHSRVVTSRATPDTWHRRVMVATLASRVWHPMQARRDCTLSMDSIGATRCTSLSVTTSAGITTPVP